MAAPICAMDEDSTTHLLVGEELKVLDPSCCDPPLVDFVGTSSYAEDAAAGGGAGGVSLTGNDNSSGNNPSGGTSEYHYNAFRRTERTASPQPPAARTTLKTHAPPRMNMGDSLTTDSKLGTPNSKQLDTANSSQTRQLHPASSAPFPGYAGSHSASHSRANTPRDLLEADLVHLKHLVLQTQQRLEKFSSELLHQQGLTASTPNSRKNTPGISPANSITNFPPGFPSMALEPREFTELVSKEQSREELVHRLCRLYDICYSFRSVAGLPLPSQLARAPSPQGDAAFTPKPLHTGVHRPKKAEIPVSFATVPEMNSCEMPSLTKEASTGSLASLARHSVTEQHAVERGMDECGNEMINNYTIIHELGRGNYGKVYLAVDDEGNQFAVKAMDCAIKAVKHRFGAAVNNPASPSGGRKQSMAFPVTPQQRNSRARSVLPDSLVMREIAIMKKLSHKNIVDLQEVIHDEEEDTVYLVMQYFDSGPIAEIAQDGKCPPLNEGDVKSYIRQAATGLEYLHRHGVVHRDVKPENILVGSDGLCCLADFGVSAVVRDGDYIDFTAGTQVFFSPELCKGDVAVVTKFGRQSDIWALGVTLYAVRFGRVPFFAKNFLALASQILEAPVEFPADLDSDDPIREVLLGMLDKNPETRWTLSKIRRHPYFDVSSLAGFDPMSPLVPANALDLSISMQSSTVVPITEEDLQTAIVNTRRATVCVGIRRMIGGGFSASVPGTRTQSLVEGDTDSRSQGSSTSRELPSVVEVGSPYRLAKARKAGAGGGAGGPLQ